MKKADAGQVENVVKAQRGRGIDFYDIDGRQNGERFYAIVFEHRWSDPVPETRRTS